MALSKAYVVIGSSRKTVWLWGVSHLQITHHPRLCTTYPSAFIQFKPNSNLLGPRGLKRYYFLLESCLCQPYLSNCLARAGPCWNPSKTLSQVIQLLVAERGLGLLSLDSTTVFSSSQPGSVLKCWGGSPWARREAPVEAGAHRGYPWGSDTLGMTWGKERWLTPGLESICWIDA